MSSADVMVSAKALKRLPVIPLRKDKGTKIIIVAIDEPIASMVAEKISKVRGVVEIKDGIVYAGDNIEIAVDPTKAAIFGLDPDKVNQQVQSQIAGKYVNNVLSKDKVIPIRIMAEDNLHSTVEQLNNIMLSGSVGKYTTLEQISSIQVQTNQTQQIRDI